MNLELKSKDILELFLGDKEIKKASKDFSEIEYRKVRMPRLTHSDISGVASTFGIDDEECLHCNRLDRMRVLTQKIIELDMETAFLN
ncbi:hypothetical protein AMC75_12080 [Staphylococcus carnosus]|uniref:hypothetical protein n=1 Tax=Staphylococcus carnosus TaxID=1281 RepID=UPI0006ABB103|nr:hypothetical protein [Staphylococcus carnosus]KOR11873.1 hypothetical protein AMC75_12080 [Staphylococcus carnosus]